MIDKDICIIGYGGHSYVALEILEISGNRVIAYCENSESNINPFNLLYLGNEKSLLQEELKRFSFFIGIGGNKIRCDIYKTLEKKSVSFVNAIHPSSKVSSYTTIGQGVMISAGATINPFVRIGNAVICNTQCSIDHECIIGDFAHIAPGAILCGNVSVGKNSFIGAGSVIKEGVKIGDNVIIGAGSVVLRNIEDGAKVAGAPVKYI